MASTSSSSIQKGFKYDVFLSFRGEDTRKNFVDNLYHALKQRGIYTYKDDEEIRKGKAISDELIRSIEDSRIYVIVFSKNYASSSWCLNELVKIMECQKKNEQTAYPVFYDVEPTEVRNQSGVVGEAFAKHVNEEAAGRWRDALKQAAGLAGWELKNTFDGHEAKFIQKIIEEISQELRFINSSVDGKLEGMEKRVKDVVSYLETDIYDVRMIGIKGMGGAGKTTLARAVFDQISFQFEGSSFVENVRENSKNQICGLKLLQKQVLSDVLNKHDITINSVYEGTNVMKQRMCGRKVLLVLDDVDDTDQLKALAGDPSWFKTGSRVIITTRDEQVLVAHGLSVNMILDVNLLSDEEANCLFNRYAFGREIPNPGFEVLSVQGVSYAAGLPLTIKVLGSSLRGQDESVWKDALDRLKTIPLEGTLKILELSYDGLENDYKEMFLNVACILKGWKKERAIRALESCDLHAIIGLRVLEQKSLITLSSGYLGMHDSIVEMGKSIVRRSHPDMPYRHSRLWINEEIEDIFVEDKGTEATRCMKVELHDPVIVMKGLRKMKELRFLEVNGITSSFFTGSFDYSSIDEDNQHLPNSLRYLCWYGYPFTCLPKRFLAKNLVGLEMSYSNIDQLWKSGEQTVLKKLRFIDLRFCKLRTLDIGLTMNLERLHIEKCSNFVELHMPIENFKLKFLSICRCTRVKTLDLERAQNLETLKVEWCEGLIELHMPVNNLKLKHLSLQHSQLKILNLAQSQNLETIDLIGCDDLVELHMPVEHIKLKSIHFYGSKLRTLDLGWVENLDKLNLEVHKELLELRLAGVKIKDLYLNRCSKLKTINLTGIRKLETIDLVGCNDLVDLHMPTESPDLKTIYISSSKMRTLNLTQTQNLAELHLDKCDDLVELHMPIENSEFNAIVINDSKIRTLYLGLSPYLQELYLNGCYNLAEIHAPVGYLSGLFWLKPHLDNQVIPMDSSLLRSLVRPLRPYDNFPKFHLRCVYYGLPLSFTETLGKLISLGLVQFRELTLKGSIPEVPKELDQLECLEELTLSSTNIEHFPDSIFMLKHLKVLRFISCWFLKQLPEDIDRLELLEELDLKGCKSLRDIPNSICEMKRLKSLHLTGCILVERLPKEIGRLKSLKELNIKGTSIIDFPPSIDQLEDLLFLF